MKNHLTATYPASWWQEGWREAFTSANGSIGAAVYGAVYEETILLNHEGLWADVKIPPLPDISHKLPEVRRLLFDGEAKTADRIMSEELKRLGYDPAAGTTLPLADLKIKMPVQAGFKDYLRTLEMETGEVCVQWNDSGRSYQRKLFVSRKLESVLLQISGPAEGFSAELYLSAHFNSHPQRLEPREREALPSHMESKAEGDFLFYAATNNDGLDFGAVARLVPRGGLLQTDSEKITLKEANGLVVLIKLFVKTDRHEAWSQLRQELEALPTDYAAALAEHAVEHGELFKRLSLDLGGTAQGRNLSNEELLLQAYKGEAPVEVVEKLFAYGRYLLISSSRPGGLPCPLVGKCCGGYRELWPWHMANENLQMIYWQALPGNLAETHLTVFDYYEGLMEAFKLNAKRIWGCRGIFVPAVTSPSMGQLSLLHPHIIHWTGGAAWISQHYFDYYLYTLDEQFLRQRALPFMREVALFYEDFFIVGDDGFFISAPSNSPENTPGNYWDGRTMTMQMETTINATMDFALAKELLNNLIQGAKITGLFQKEIPKWEGMLTRIPLYQINEDGAIKEWMHPDLKDNYNHRHQSHIYPLFPGREITRQSPLFKAFEIAIRKRLEIGITEQTSWSLVHMAHVFARLGDGDSALECLDLIARSCITNNFYSAHNDWRCMGIGMIMALAPFQIDTNMGWTSAIQEMLLFSAPGQIRVLPALPKRWRRGSISGLVAMGGITVSIEWNGTDCKLHLCSPRQHQLQVSFGCAQEVQTVELPANKPVTLNATISPPLGGSDRV